MREMMEIKREENGRTRRREMEGKEEGDKEEREDGRRRRTRGQMMKKRGERHKHESK